MNRGKKVFTIKVILENTIEYLDVHEFDAPWTLSAQFCYSNNLDKIYESIIQKEIEKCIEKVIKGQFDDLEEFNNTGNNLEINYENFSNLRTMGSLHLSDLKTTQNNNTGLKRFNKSVTPYRISKKTREQYLKIFNYMHPTPDKRLCIRNILELNLRHRLYKILMPIIIDIDLSNSFLSFNEFCLKLEVLMKFLSNEDKRYILAPGLWISSKDTKAKLKNINNTKVNWTSKDRNCVSPIF
jgi:hypothetical protein